MAELRCTACGMRTQTKCSCGKPYDYIRAAEAAARAVAAHPDWSARRLAETVGVAPNTIIAAQAGVQNCTPEKRIGRNGKAQASHKRRPSKQDKVQDAVDALVRDGKPVSRKKIGEEHGVGETTVHFAIAKAQGKLEAEPEIRPEDLSISARQKLEAAMRQYQNKLDAEFDWRVRSDIKRRVDELVMPSLREREEDAALVIKARKGVFKPEEYRAILRCIHPDAQPTIEQKNEAFRLVHEKRIVLLSEKDDANPKVYRNLPSVDEFMDGWNTKAKATN